VTLLIRSERSFYTFSQSDFYQLFAYGHKYLEGGQGELALIYPRRAVLQEALKPFEFAPGLTLKLIPFDLEELALVVGIEQTTLPLKAAALLI
jgi:5-methylcytosine-specific restriction enzyme subunit McrC